MTLSKDETDLLFQIVHKQERPLLGGYWNSTLRGLLTQGDFWEKMTEDEFHRIVASLVSLGYLAVVPNELNSYTIPDINKLAEIREILVPMKKAHDSRMKWERSLGLLTEYFPTILAVVLTAGLTGFFSAYFTAKIVSDPVPAIETIANQSFVVNHHLEKVLSNTPTQAIEKVSAALEKLILVIEKQKNAPHPKAHSPESR